MCNTESEPNVNYGLWVVMMCQCRFIDCDKRTTLVADVGGEGLCLWEAESYMGTLYFMLSFAGNLKLL